MIALDTNLVVRVITNDDPTQAQRAAGLMRQNPTWLGKTVLVECEWVLRYTYGFAPADIHRALSTMVGLRGLEVEDRPAVARALDWYQAGLDLADALHLASASRASELATFDRKLASRAKRLGTTPAVRLVQ